MAINRIHSLSVLECPLAERCLAERRFGQRQSGITLACFLMALLLVGIGAGTALRLLPLYVDHMRVRRALHDTKDQLIDNLLNQQQTDVSTIEAQLLEKLRERGVARVTRQNITVTPVADGFTMAIDYDARTPWMPWIGPIDLIVHFHLEQEALRPDG